MPTVKDALKALARPKVKRSAEPAGLRRPDGTFLPGQGSAHPGGQSRERRDFLAQLRGEDAAEVYAALLELVRQGNAPATLRAFEYIAGKPKEHIEITTGPAPAQLDFSRLSLAEKLELERLMVLASPLAASLPSARAADQVITVEPEK